MIIALIAILLYFLPTVIALRSKLQSCDYIIMINVFFGWTGIGWLWALLWSVCGEPKKPIIPRCGGV